MSRTYRLLAVVALAVLMVGVAPAAAAPATGWDLFAAFSPFEWLRHLWAEEGTETSPWVRASPAGNGIGPAGAPRVLWGATGTSVSPWGEPAPAPQNSGSSSSPSGL